MSGTTTMIAERCGYGVDSLRMGDLFLSLEAVFDIAIEEADPTLASVETVRDLANYPTAVQHTARPPLLKRHMQPRRQ